VRAGHHYSNEGLRRIKLAYENLLYGNKVRSEVVYLVDPPNGSTFAVLDQGITYQKRNRRN
jgi:hypothetical protein